MFRRIDSFSKESVTVFCCDVREECTVLLGIGSVEGKRHVLLGLKMLSHRFAYIRCLARDKRVENSTPRRTPSSTVGSIFSQNLDSVFPNRFIK